MATPRYPADLPGVATHILTPTDQLLRSDNDSGPESLRRRSVQPSANAQISFRYSKEEYSLFKAWWTDVLLFGHRWFLIRIPSAGGITWHYVRFTDRYRSKLVGHRYWDVSASIELRERAFAPVDLDYAIILSSNLYPVHIVDELDTAANLITGRVLAPVSDYMEATANIIQGSLDVVVAYLTHSLVSESFDNAANITAGSLTVAVSYLTYDVPSESFDSAASIQAGSLTVVAGYLDYTIPAESLDPTANLISGVLA